MKCPACDTETIAPYSAIVPCCNTLNSLEVKRRRLAGEEIPITDLNVSGGGVFAKDGVVCCSLLCAAAYEMGAKVLNTYGLDSWISLAPQKANAAPVETKVEAVA